MILRGRRVTGGCAEGEALVTRETISGWGGIDFVTGAVVETRHELRGVSFKDKILVFPGAKGSSGWSNAFHMTRLTGSAPKAMLFKTMTTKIALGAVVMRIPAVTDLDRDPLSVIRTGDWVKVDGDRGVVEVVPRFDLQPHLSGELLALRPLRSQDWEDLFAVARDPLIWEVHPARDRYREEVFREFFQEALDSGGALVALDRKTGEIIGSSRYFWRQPDELEIGWTFLARAYWGGIYNREMKRLMLDYAFQFVDRVVFLVGTGNIRSQKAMRKIGGMLSERRVERTLHGKSSEHVLFEIRRPGLTAP